MFFADAFLDILIEDLSGLATHTDLSQNINFICITCKENFQQIV